MIRIAAVIPTHNRLKYLKNILNDLYGQEPNNSILEIIVVVDGSTDGTLEMLKKEYPKVKIVLGNGEWWYTKSMNEGFKLGLKLNEDFFLTLNDDISLPGDYIKKLLDDYNRLEKNSILGSISISDTFPYRITFSGVKKIIMWRLKEIPYIKKFSTVCPDKLSGIFPSPILSGRGILIPVKLLTELNYYDEKLPQYGSETDFCLRAFKNNINIYITYNAQVYENKSLTSKGAAYNKPRLSEFVRSMFDIYSINSIRKSLYMYRKHCNRLAIPILFVILTLGLFKVYFLKYRSLK
jgi:GT2 family glycosyltransferase